MEKRYNLYYLFLEDKEKHPMPDDQKEKILNTLQALFRRMKPP